MLVGACLNRSPICGFYIWTQTEFDNLIKALNGWFQQGGVTLREENLISDEEVLWHSCLHCNLCRVLPSLEASRVHWWESWIVAASCLLPGLWKTLCFAIENGFGCFEYELLELEIPWVLMEEADGWKMLRKMQCIYCLAEKQWALRWYMLLRVVVPCWEFTLFCLFVLFFSFEGSNELSNIGLKSQPHFSCAAVQCCCHLCTVLEHSSV